MAVFKYSLEPWTDDHGMVHQLALVGRDALSGAAIVGLHHDQESDLYLYGYWADGIFGKVFVSEVRGFRDPEPAWELYLGSFRYEPARPGQPSAEELEPHIARIVEALSQCPEGDVSRATPGVVVRRILLK
ncbi:MAG: hypothetical protein K2X72_21735 [Reyranella sp.]|nr:hypothetical protein [Reyranella sp.]